MAVNAAQSLVVSRPAALHASADDAFVQHSVISSTNGLKYVPYDRTYKGLPVVGGDFVVATNSTGQVLTTSVAQNSTINLASTTPKLTAKDAEAVARKQLSTVNNVGAAQLVTFALGTPALAWQSTVTGTKAGEPSKLDVVVDATTGKVLHTQEHVLFGDGTGVWNGPEPLHIDTTHSGSTFSMQDPNLTNVSCQDAANNTTFTKSTDSWGNGDETNREGQAGDPTCSATGSVTVSNPGNQSTATGTAVSLPLSASGGTAPYTWSATGLPACPSTPPPASSPAPRPPPAATVSR